MATSTDTLVDSVTNETHEERISEAVVSAVAAASDVDPLEMEPLYNVVDPDALNAVFRGSENASATDMEVRFSMGGCRVVVRGPDDVVAIPNAADEQPAAVGSHEE